MLNLLVEVKLQFSLTGGRNDSDPCVVRSDGEAGDYAFNEL